MSPVSPLHLDLMLVRALDPEQIQGPSSGPYGVTYCDLLSLTFLIIHSVKSVTTLTILDTRSPDIPPRDRGTNLNVRAAQSTRIKIFSEVSESVVSTVHAHARCVVLPVVASAMQWHFHSILSPYSSSSSSR
jgi:hypothetical protein